MTGDDPLTYLGFRVDERETAPADKLLVIGDDLAKVVRKPGRRVAVVDLTDVPGHPDGGSTT